jgi:hypothetical protein
MAGFSGGAGIAMFAHWYCLAKLGECLLPSAKAERRRPNAADKFIVVAVPGPISAESLLSN